MEMRCYSLQGLFLSVNIDRSSRWIGHPKFAMELFITPAETHLLRKLNFYYQFKY